MKRLAALAMIMAIMATCAWAHQPRIAFGERHPPEDPVIVEKPEISKAYYGELRGEPDYYKIVSARPFRFYLNILAPDEESARTDTRVDVIVSGRTAMTVGGRGRGWKPFYEKFADDHYLRGPESEQTVEAGTYYLKVYNSDNMGKYALAVGKAESFPLDETVKTAFTLPVIKKHFFNKPAYSAFLNLVGLFLAVELFTAVAVISGAALFIKMIVYRKRKRKAA